MGVLLILIKPVQLPLHEPYFDLTPIRATHTKIYYYIFRTNFINYIQIFTKLIAHTLFSMRRVVST